MSFISSGSTPLPKSNYLMMAFALLSISAVITVPIFFPLGCVTIVIISFASLSFLISAALLVWNVLMHYHKIAAPTFSFDEIFSHPPKLANHIKTVFSAKNKNAFNYAMEDLLRFLMKFTAGVHISPETTLALIQYCREKSTKDRNYMSVAFAVQAARMGQICLVDESTPRSSCSRTPNCPYLVQLHGKQKVFKPYYVGDEAINSIDSNIAASVVSQFLEGYGAPQMQMHAGPGIIFRKGRASLGLSADYIEGNRNIKSFFYRSVTYSQIKEILEDIDTELKTDKNYYAHIQDDSMCYGFTCNEAILGVFKEHFTKSSDGNGVKFFPLKDSEFYSVDASSCEAYHLEGEKYHIRKGNLKEGRWKCRLTFPPTIKYTRDTICIGVYFNESFVRTINIPCDKEIVRQITWLQLCDVLIGACDRGTPSNILLNNDRVIGIDNDDVCYIIPVESYLEKICLVDQEMLNVFQSIPGDQLRKLLSNGGIKTCKIDAICERLKLLQDHLSKLKRDNKVIERSAWEEQSDDIFQNPYIYYAMTDGYEEVISRYLRFYEKYPNLPKGDTHDRVVKILTTIRKSESNYNLW
jgi:hypothetical protein